MATVYLVPVGALYQALTDTGAIGNGYKLYTYVGGTVSTLQTTYTDSTGTVANSNPIILGSNGRFQSVNVWVTIGVTLKLVLTDSTGSAISGGTIDNVPAINNFLKYDQTAAEISAGIVPSNYNVQPGYPERYGAIGDGTTSDQTALANCFLVNDTIYFPAGKTYLVNGITITTVGKIVIGLAGGNKAYLKVSGTSGSFGLKFISPSGNGTHFSSGFFGSNFNISCAASANKIKGIWCDNAEINGLENVYIDMSTNTFAGAVRDATNAFHGDFQQDGRFTKCHFTGGGGANGDGLFLTGNAAGNRRPNNNTFIACRAQSSGGWGVRNCLGDGNTWVGGKFQSNVLGGWLDSDDGLGNGPSSTVILSAGFEVNTGSDFKADVTDRLRLEDNAFQSTTSTNAILITYATNSSFAKNSSTASKPATISGGTNNRWDRSNSGFSLVTTAANTNVVSVPSQLTYSGSGSISADHALINYVKLNVTSGAAFTINAPTNPRDGDTLTYEIINSTGGSIGTITWPGGGGGFFMAGAFTNPANTKRRTITFQYDGAAFIEISRAAADI